jgi:hypothetical protein
MPLIEEIQDDAGPSWSPGSLGPILKELSARLALPEELLASFMGGDIRESYHGYTGSNLTST